MMPQPPAPGAAPADDTDRWLLLAAIGGLAVAVILISRALKSAQDDIEFLKVVAREQESARND